MKKIIVSIIIFCAFSIYGNAQTSGAVVTTSPSNFTAEDLVEITIDVSNVPNLAGKSPLYWWTWNPSEPAPGNGSWTNSNEVRKLTNAGPNKWKVTITPTEFYGKSPSEITKIEFLVKAKDGTGDAKTDNIALNVTPLIFVPSVNRIFPSRLTKDDIATIYFDQSLANDQVQQRMTPQSVEIKLFNTNSTIVATVNVPLKKIADKLFSYSFIPALLSGILPNTSLSKFEYTFKGTTLDINGNSIPAQGPTFTKQFDPLQ